MGNYLKRRGMSPQKPIKRAYEQSAPAVKQGLQERYPAIARRAKAQEAEIHWGTVTNQGKTRWMIIDGAFNHARLIEFFQALIQDTEHKVFLILDNLGVHHCKPVKAWLSKHGEQIEVFICPATAPNSGPLPRPT